MNRKMIFNKTVEMIAFHRDLQNLPTSYDIRPFLHRYFEVPEEGVFYNDGIYQINSYGVYVTPWEKQRPYRFSWKSIIVALKKVSSYEEPLV